MKKFFGILLAAVSAVVLLPGCGGGGGGESRDVVTPTEFASAVKVIKLGGQNGETTLYMTGSTHTYHGYIDGDILKDGRFQAGVGSRGAMADKGTVNYTVTRDDKGAIEKGILVMAFDNVGDNDEVVDFFGFEGNNNDDDDDAANNDDDDEEVADSNVLQVELRFKESFWQDNQGHQGTLWVERM